MVLTFIDLIPQRIVKDDLEPLQRGPHGWICCEGDHVLFNIYTDNLPVVRMAGRTLPPQKLERLGARYNAHYEIFIDTWAGRTTVDLCDGVKHSFVILDVGPSDRKFSEDEFEGMLFELSVRSPGLIWGLSPGKRGGDSNSSTLAVVHPAIISSQLPTLKRLLAIFIADPPRLTVRAREARQLDLSKRADLRTLRWLGRRPIVLDALRGSRASRTTIDARTPIDQAIALSSFDHPVTRYFAYLLRRLVLRFRNSAHALRHSQNGPFRNPLIEAHATSLADQMDGAIRETEAILSHRLFRSIKPNPMDNTVLQSLPDHPLYSAIYRSARILLEPGLAYGPGASLQSALKNTYDLFELFVLYRLIDQLPEALGNGWALALGKSFKPDGREERPINRAAWLFTGPGGLSLELRYQQGFLRAKSPPDNRLFTSLSGMNIPDYILVLRRERVPVSWVILDAKYRSGRQAVDQGLGDVHRYRDALRVRGIKASGAYIIVPRLQEFAAAYATAAYLEHHMFGVIQVLSTNWLSEVRKALFRAADGNASLD